MARSFKKRSSEITIKFDNQFYRLVISCQLLICLPMKRVPGGVANMILRYAIIMYIYICVRARPCLWALLWP